MVRIPLVRHGARVRNLGMSVALAVASLAVVAPIPAAANGATTWHVTVGGGDPTSFFLGANRFYMPAITVHKGDTVEFAWAGFHTVTFNPPKDKSVFDFAFPPGLDGPNTCPEGSPAKLRCLDTPKEFVTSPPAPPGGPGSGPPPPFDVRIGDNLPTGTYHYQCMLHQYMNATIKVVSPNKRLPKTDAQYQAEALALMNADVQRVRALDAAFTQGSGGDRAKRARANALIVAAARDNGGANEDGATVGVGDRVVEAIKFYPGSFSIRSGESVTWVDRDPHDPHSVTLGKDPGMPAEAFASGPSGSTYDGKEVKDLNSGYLFSRSQAKYWRLNLTPFASITPTTRWTVRFVNNGTAPVTFNFFCVIHSQVDPETGKRFGMQGWVTVLPSNDD